MSKIIRCIKSLAFINRYKDEQELKLLAMQQELVNLKQELSDVALELHRPDKIVQAIRSNKESLMSLNQGLSTAPTIWGDESRLHVSPTAAVFPALFNTNSGEIHIGEYSFAGSNVSFLTGCHDIQLTGLLRRDCEIKEGNNIYIGKGVWIASNATIIGPCKIGDNAVVAAGAVVTPGTIINENEIYAGIPAKKISEIAIDVDQSMESECVKKALNREGGVLFVDGWSDKRIIEHQNVRYEGHYMISDNAIIYSSGEALSLFYRTNKENPLVEINGNAYSLSNSNGVICVQESGVLSVRKECNMECFFANAKRSE